MTNDATVSVIIPAYRAAATIGRAMDSLLAQTRPPDEIIVIDDGSPDDLAGALAPYANRFTLLRQENSGVASARNRGLEHARGSFIAFLDADDCWEPDKLARQLNIFREHPELGLVASRFYVQEPGRERYFPAAAVPPIYDRVLTLAGEAAFEAATWVLTSTVLVRRAALGGQRFDPQLRTAQDRDLWVRLVNASPVYLSSEPLITYVLEPGSLSRSNLDNDNGNMLRVVRRYGGLLGRGGLRKWEALVFRQWAAGHLGGGRPRAALPYAWERVRRQPCSAEGWWVFVKSATLAWTTRPMATAAPSLRN
jgi:glycosyltransferase involved in cell wall biosynthesis